MHGEFNKVLFVDDEEKVIKSLKRLMMDEDDCELFSATSGAAALEILKENPDTALIVSDQRMPRMTGIEFLEEAIKITPDALRIILTGYADNQAAVDAINKAAAHRYISKPWDDNELLTAIRNELSRYALKKENDRLSSVVKEQNEEIKKWNSELEHIVQLQTIELTKKNDTLTKVNDKLHSNFKHIIQSFSLLLGIRDKTAPTHARNVAEISKRVAKDIGLSSREVETITTASILHDTGKIGSHDIVLAKSVREMNPEEIKEYRRHPVRGQTAVGKIEDLRNAGILIRHHHESYDGTGFPDGLSGEDIPIGSRIIHFADFVDNTISLHPGKEAWARTIMGAEAFIGKELDPGLFVSFKASTEGYYKNISTARGVIEEELEPKDLTGNMVVSRDVRSGSGMLLLSKGRRLNDAAIRNLKHILSLDPSESGIFVWINK